MMVSAVWRLVVLVVCVDVPMAMTSRRDRFRTRHLLARSAKFPAVLGWDQIAISVKPVGPEFVSFNAEFRGNKQIDLR